VGSLTIPDELSLFPGKALPQFRTEHWATGQCLGAEGGQVPVYGCHLLPLAHKTKAAPWWLWVTPSQTKSQKQRQSFLTQNRIKFLLKYLAAKVLLLLEAVGSITKPELCADFSCILFIKSQPHPQADELIPVFQ
jgi:hypothetical protein